MSYIIKFLQDKYLEKQEKQRLENGKRNNNYKSFYEMKILKQRENNTLDMIIEKELNKAFAELQKGF